MLRNISSSLHKVSARVAVSRNTSAPIAMQTATFGTAEKKGSILDAWKKSCYHKMDFTISEDATVYEAVEKFSAYDVGALVTVDSEGACRLESNESP